MKKISIFIITIATSFCFGFAFKSALQNESNEPHQIKRVTSIGGIFFKCKDPKKMREWYATHLGLKTNKYGSVFEWRHATDSTNEKRFFAMESFCRKN